MKKRIVFVVVFLLLVLAGAGLHREEASAAVLDQSQIAKVIWFGDSRTVFFAKAVYGSKAKKGVRPTTILNSHVVAQRSATYSWANGGGYRALAKRLKARPDSVVIFNFGVNDLGRGYNRRSSYVNLVKKICRKFPNATVCIMSVNPVKASSRNPYTRTSARARSLNRKIDAFNRYMYRHLYQSCPYINTNKAVKFSYKDGLHYTYRTYRNIAYYIFGYARLQSMMQGSH